jgi:hypothetical protein
MEKQTPYFWHFLEVRDFGANDRLITSGSLELILDGLMVPARAVSCTSLPILRS